MHSLAGDRQGQQSHPTAKGMGTDLTEVTEKEVSGTPMVCCPCTPSCSEEELTRSLH